LEQADKPSQGPPAAGRRAAFNTPMIGYLWACFYPTRHRSSYTVSRGSGNSGGYMVKALLMNQDPN